MDTKICSLIPGYKILPFLQLVNMYTCMKTHIYIWITQVYFFSCVHVYFRNHKIPSIPPIPNHSTEFLASTRIISMSLHTEALDPNYSLLINPTKVDRNYLTPAPTTNTNPLKAIYLQSSLPSTHTGNFDFLVLIHTAYLKMSP